jgi:hypothetical protein
MFEKDDDEDSIIQCIITIDTNTAKITYDALSLALERWPGCIHGVITEERSNLKI